MFSFGTGYYFGSLPGEGIVPSAPIVAMAADPKGGGYWLVGSDGGVFTFGTAGFYGSEGTLFLNGPLPNPTTAFAASPDGAGYVLLPSDPAVEPGVPGRSGFSLAKPEWVGDGTLSCALQTPPLLQAAQYLLIGESVDGGNTSGYPAVIDELHQVAALPGMSRTPAQNATGEQDTNDLDAFFGAQAEVPCPRWYVGRDNRRRYRAPAP